jgi:hypothetical protein
MNDANDNYRIVKTRLDKIIKNKGCLKRINDIVFTVNHIVIHAYQFIKMYFIYRYYHKMKFPIIDETFVEHVIKTVSIKEDFRGNHRITEATKRRLAILKKFYDMHYLPTIEHRHTIPSSYKLYTNILYYEVCDIVKNINNMISLTYFQKIKKLLYFIYIKPTHTKEQVKILRKELYLVFNDIININDVEIKDLKSDKKYHEYIKKNKYSIFCKKDTYKENNVYYDIKANPQDYLLYLVRICRVIESISLITGCKTYSPFPLRTNLKPKYILLDSTSVVNSILTKNITYYKNNISKKNEEIWEHVLKLNSKIFKRKGLNFSYMIKTDGVGCSLYFNKGDKKNKFQEGYKRNNKSKTEDEYFVDIKIDRKIKNKNIVGIDVGKHNLLYCIDNKSSKTNKNYLRYTCKQRLHETRSTYFNKIINNKRSSNPVIKEIETKLSEYSNRTSSLRKYIDNLKIRNKHLPTLLEFYKNERFRIYRWFTFINTQRSEAKFINKFKQKFGSPEKTLIAIGDWSQKEQLPFMPPTKGLGFRKMFRKHKYDVKLIAEQYTSKKCHFCENSETEKFMEVKKNDKNILLNGLLRCTNNECLEGYEHRIFQRDLNGALNILEIATCIIRGKKRPKKFNK